MNDKQGDIVIKSGALSILDLGSILVTSTYHHRSDMIIPDKFKSIRAFWSMSRPLQRTTYLFDILSEVEMEEYDIDMSTISPYTETYDDYVKYALHEPSADEMTALLTDPTQLIANTVFPSSIFDVYTDPTNGSGEGEGEGVTTAEASKPIYRVFVTDQPDIVLLSRSVYHIYLAITCLVNQCRETYINKHNTHNTNNTNNSSTTSNKQSSNGNMLSTYKPRTTFSSFGLNPGQFFGFGLPYVKEALELRPESVVPMTTIAPVMPYMPVYSLPTAQGYHRLMAVLRAKRGEFMVCVLYVSVLY